MAPSRGPATTVNAVPRAVPRPTRIRHSDPRTRTFRSRDARTRTLSPARCVNGLMPLLLPDLPAGQAESIMDEARSARFGLPERTGLPLPSYDRTAPDFDLARFWSDWCVAFLASVPSYDTTLRATPRAASRIAREFARGVAPPPGGKDHDQGQDRGACGPRDSFAATRAAARL